MQRLLKSGSNPGRNILAKTQMEEMSTEKLRSQLVEQRLVQKLQKTSAPYYIWKHYIKVTKLWGYEQQLQLLNT